MTDATAIHDFTPDQLAAIVKVEALLRLRELKAEWRTHYQAAVSQAASTTAPFGNAA